MTNETTSTATNQSSGHVTYTGRLISPSLPSRFYYGTMPYFSLDEVKKLLIQFTKSKLNIKIDGKNYHVCNIPDDIFINYLNETLK